MFHVREEKVAKYVGNEDDEEVGTEGASKASTVKADLSRLGSLNCAVVVEFLVQVHQQKQRSHHSHYY